MSGASVTPLAIVHPGVHFAGAHSVAAFAIVGEAPRGAAPGALVTHFGPDAVIRSHSVIYAGNRIGARFQTGHGVMVREENEIGDDVSIGTGSVVEHHVKIGHGVRLHSKVFVPEYSVLEDGCWLGPNVVLTNAKYPKSPGAKHHLVGPHIEKGAKIGANTTILPGVRIGANALIGAGSVVTKDVPAGEVHAGNPARFIKSLSSLPY